MRRYLPIALLLAVCALFLILNRAAYKGYFSDDDFDNILTTRDLTPAEWSHWFFTPQLSTANFRPAGHIYYFALNRMAGLNFPGYVVPLQALHLLNIMLLWLLLLRLGVNPYAAVAGAAFFALNVSAFDAFWKPQCIFDVLCTTFCLATLVMYSRGHWILAILTMWLGYKSKELAIMLPLVLLAYEYWFGERRWLTVVPRLAPFLLISLCFGIQAVLSPQPKGNPYAFVFTLSAFWQTLSFYSSRLFLLPFVGLALLALPFAIRDRRIWFGAVMLAAFFAPLMFLPGRMFAVYTYLPLTGAAIELAILASLVPPAATLAFFAIWIPWNVVELRAERKVTLTADDQVRQYAGALMSFTRANPKPPRVAFWSAPESFKMWGIQAALNYPYRTTLVTPEFMDEPHAQTLPADARVTFINWDRKHNQVQVLSKDPALPEASYLKMGPDTPFWQLGRGWYGLDDYFRWTEPHASARLMWPPDVTQFEMIVNVSPSILKANGHVDISPRINGRDLGVQRFDRGGLETMRWSLPARDQERATVELTFEPAGHFPPDPRTLGAPVVAFGFVPNTNGH